MNSNNDNHVIRVEGLTKSFGDNQVLKDINFDVNKGDVIAVIGSSGSGKSTLLRCLIDLEQADGGTIEIEGRRLVSDGVHADNKEKRAVIAEMGMVFQHFNLFPHLSVRENLELAPKLRSVGTEREIEDRTAYYLDKVGLSERIDAMPSTLSGGEKQRVAIARALMMRPDILLFDEPTSALDPEMTAEILDVIADLREAETPLVLVTHEMGFARETADMVAFIADGQVRELAPAQTFFENPASEEARRFLARVLKY